MCVSGAYNFPYCEGERRVVKRRVGPVCVICGLFMEVSSCVHSGTVFCSCVRVLYLFKAVHVMFPHATCVPCFVNVHALESFM